MVATMEESARILIDLLKEDVNILEYSKDHGSIWTDFFGVVENPDIAKTCRYINKNNMDSELSYSAKQKYGIFKRSVYMDTYRELDARGDIIYNGKSVSDEVKSKALRTMKKYNIPETQSMYKSAIKYILALEEAEG